jgi:pilus assembly protein CpaE
MTAGQVAMMLNMPLKRTWTDIARYSADELDVDVLMSIIGTHESGLSFIAAPTFPSEAETLRGETLGTALRLMKDQFDYLVADLPHDFSEPALQALDVADVILMVATPDMSSIRAVAAAMDTYVKLGYQKEKIKLILNAIFPRSSLSKEKIESASGVNTIVTIPYVQDVFVDAINLGQPTLYHRPHESVSALLEDFALLLSKDEHRKSKPEQPTEAWKRVYKRYQERKKR